MPKSGKVRIKSKVVRSTLQDKDVLDMFHGVLGTDGASINFPIVWLKYKRIRYHTERFIKLIQTFTESSLMKQFSEETMLITSYHKELRIQFDTVFISPDLDRYIDPDKAPISKELNTGQPWLSITPDFSKAPKKELEKFEETFKIAKNCNIVNLIIQVCNNLIKCRYYLREKEQLNDKFLTKTAGSAFCPLPNLDAANFKYIYNSDLTTDTDKKLILQILHKMYVISYEVYRSVSDPDVDIDEFVDVIMNSLQDVRKHIPRCDQAFDKIAESVYLLKDNFSGYYRDYVASNNPTVIMENFVLDVSKNTSPNARLTAQFRNIITHYRKLASQQANNPKMRALFQQVDKNYQELERQTRQGGGQESEPDAEERGEEPDAEERGGEPDAEEGGGEPDAEERGVCGNSGKQKKRKRRDKCVSVPRDLGREDIKTDPPIYKKPPGGVPVIDQATRLAATERIAHHLNPSDDSEDAEDSPV